MKTIKACIAISNIKDKVGNLFTSKALKNAIKTAKKDLVVTENFDNTKIIGKINSMNFSSNQLIAEIQLLDNISIDNKKLFRIAGIIKKKTGNKIKDIELLNVGMIDKVRDIYSIEINRKE